MCLVIRNIGSLRSQIRVLKPFSSERFTIPHQPFRWIKEIRILWLVVCQYRFSIWCAQPVKNLVALKRYSFSYIFCSYLTFTAVLEYTWILVWTKGSAHSIYWWHRAIQSPQCFDSENVKNVYQSRKIEVPTWLRREFLAGEWSAHKANRACRIYW